MKTPSEDHCSSQHPLTTKHTQTSSYHISFHDLCLVLTSVTSQCLLPISQSFFLYRMQLTQRNHSLAASEAVWSSNKPPSNLFTGQSFTMCDTDWEQSNSQTHDLLIISSTSLLLCNPSTVMDLLQLWPQLKLCKSKQGQQKRRSSRLITVVTYKEEMSGGADARHCARYINCSMMLCVIDARLRWELNCSTWALLQPL